MPVKIRGGLPAADVLASENVFVMTDRRAASQDIRPLSILALNLMPAKQTTEAQILRLLSNSALQVEVTFLHTASYSPKHTDHTHLEVFYETFERVRDQRFDGLIITGAPVELMDFIAALEQALGQKAEMRFKGMQQGDVQDTWADTRLLQHLTGFQRKTSIQDGVARLVQWYREHYAESVAEDAFPATGSKPVQFRSTMKG